MPLTTIPKLRPQWKIIHEFKPNAAHGNNHTSPASLTVDGGGGRIFEIDFPLLPHPQLPTNPVQMRLVRWEGNGHNEVVVAVCHAPDNWSTWSRCEVSHERDAEGNYTLAMAVGGTEVGRVGLEHELSNLEDVKIYCGGYSRGLIVLEKS